MSAALRNAGRQTTRGELLENAGEISRIAQQLRAISGSHFACLYIRSRSEIDDIWPTELEP